MNGGRRLRAALAGLLTLLVLAGCGYGSERVDTGARVAPKGPKLSVDEVRVGYFPNLTHATALVGVREGFLQKELGGTKLATATFNAGPATVEALTSGSVDLAWMGPSPAINSYTKSGGKSLRIVAGAASRGVRLVVNPDRIRTVADVKGKRIASPQLGNTQDVALLNWISRQGWQVDAASGRGDVSVVRTDNRLAPSAYRSGSIDGAWVPEPTASLLVAEGAKVLLDEADLWPDGQFVITHLVVSQRFLTEHRDVVEAVVRGSVRTNAWINSRPGPAKASANAALRHLTGKELPQKIIDAAWPSLTFTDDPLAGTLGAQAEHAVRAGLMRRPDLTGIYDLHALNTLRAAAGRPAADDAGLGVPRGVAPR
ncbi:ABC transporter substrate-binding protein [Streptomyces calvus]|uniref:NitT/TauT family transport system substrate-binding protein n=1 Tax=Streptomyces calvus TaxID=67282 RepID=A0AA40SKY7_9ACTN|nr:ABC transporter substrate-binding protein [Streptomyces calvus]MBA8948218.1 NitT/TauT family transport system substrate-binding protein [Streptomyces calvus]GGP85134.1 lipoprotein [Streptomyces calvus]